MTIRTIARILLAGIFIVGGWDTLQHPKSQAEAAGDMGTRIAEKLGLPTDPLELAKVNGAVQLGGGVLLALGWMPRAAALTLAATLVPNTASTHRFWEIDDPDRRKTQMMHLFKNGSIVGGLIMTALDHGGRPSVFWMTRKATDRAGDALAGAVEKVTG
jgi:putative oxidoreductase